MFNKSPVVPLILTSILLYITFTSWIIAIINYYYNKFKNEKKNSSKKKCKYVCIFISVYYYRYTGTFRNYYYIGIWNRLVYKVYWHWTKYSFVRSWLKFQLLICVYFREFTSPDTRNMFTLAPDRFYDLAILWPILYIVLLLLRRNNSSQKAGVP